MSQLSRSVCLILCVVFVGGCQRSSLSSGDASAGAAPRPPVVAARPHQIVSLNGTRSDDYYWLRDDTRKQSGDARVISRPRTPTPMRCWRTRSALQEKLYSEIVGRIKQDDSTVPYRKRGYLVLPSLRDGQGISDLRAQAGIAGRARAGHARRQRDGARPRFFPGRRLGGEPGQQAARLGGGHRRPAAIHAARQESRHRRGAAGSGRRTSSRISPGPRTTARCSTSRRIR